MRIKCPKCGAETTWEGNPVRPFCSERCKLLDLGRWASESYRIPDTDELPGDDPDETEH